ncbi:flagellar type III secretion system pore protein FliP [Candidatus Poribacteria bacterium]|nr:flagellar type III secretion system pore protein FliP [Candidatus Poribacteria bacterium]
MKYLLTIILIIMIVKPVHAQVSITLPKVEIDNKETEGIDLSTGIKILLLLTALSLAPAFLLLMTSFTRIVIVLSLVRTALAIHQTPPNQVIIGMALFLTLFVMAPTWQQVNSQGIQPYMAGDVEYKSAIEQGFKPIRDFMFRQTDEKELALMVNISKMEKPQNEDDVPTHVLIPAFILSELNIAFRMGFMLFIPFIVIDMVVASILMSLGMMMLPPVMISLPFKILLFVMVDGWRLVVQSLIAGFN